MKVKSPALTILSSGTSASGCGSCATNPAVGGATAIEAELRALVERAAAEGAPVEQPSPGGRTEVSLALDAPVPLVAELHHEEVDGRHAWVGVQEAALAVFDDGDHDVVTRLVAGAPPSAVAATTPGGWDHTAAVLARLAAAGLVRGLDGYRDRTRLSVGRFSRIHLTKACQLECAHCYADSSPHVDRSNELPTSRWMQFLDDFAAQGGERVLFTGGEALLHEGCLDLMAAARDLGLHVTLFSNGIRVFNRVDAIAASAHQVQISLDGPDAESNDAIRGRNSYNHIVRALDALAERGVPTRIGMTIVPSTWRTWVEHFEAVRARYAPFPHVTFKLSYGVMAYGRGASIDPTETATKAEVDAFLASVNGDMSPQITRHRAGCGYAEQIVVAWDGNVHPCHLLDGAVCHLDDMPLPEIVALLGGVARQVDVDHVEGCSSCEIRYLCGGGCRVMASRSNGTRLVTECTPDDKRQKYRNLVASFGALVPT